MKSGNPEFPFCSERCRTIDLGKWASGAYVIPSSDTDADVQLRTDGSEDRDSEDDSEKP